jgi:predicted metal-dependent hydrolase
MRWFGIKISRRKSLRRRAVNSSLTRSHYLKEKVAAKRIILNRLDYWIPLCGVTTKRVAIRDQRRRWGSCSSLGNLNFNYKTAFLPPALLDYIIVHELSHLKQMNHGPLFWAEVERVLPNYKESIIELRKLEKEGFLQSVTKLTLG